MQPGSLSFIARFEALLGRSLTAGKRGRKPKGSGNGGNE
jgi:hypothetical protein